MAKSHLSLVRSPDATSAPPAGIASPWQDRATLVRALRARDRDASVAFFREFEPLVERTIGRLIGFGDELPDATQEAFLRAMRSLDRLRDPQALVDWLLQISVCTASDFRRRRKRRRWLSLFENEKLEEPLAPSVDEQSREALVATYRVLDRMSDGERSVFVLRFIDGMDIDTLASAHDCSRSTVKRRLGRAVARFTALARHERALSEWVAGAETSVELEEEAP